MITEPVRLPAAVGLKVTEIWQLPAAATDVPQVFVWAKSPVAEIEEIASVTVPEFVSITDCAELATPTD
jgi:hypothetical protein